MKTVEAKSSPKWVDTIREWHQKHNQIYYLILPVFVNLLLTLTAWVYVYEMRVDKSPVSMLFFDREHNQTTGSDLYDGMLNGLVCVVSVGILSFVMLGFALYDFRRLIQCWLSLSCLLIMFCVSATFFTHLLNKFGIDNVYLVSAMTLVYGTVGVLAFFTNKLPLVFHQIYVVTNCSLVSLLYLQILPNHTTWFLLAGIVAWDIFAVLTPLGPLRQVTSKAQDYSEDILRFLMFSTAKDEDTEEKHVGGDETPKTAIDFLDVSAETIEEWSLDEQSILNKAFCERDGSVEIEIDELNNETVDEHVQEKIEEETLSRTAHDALNDSSARLGMGDFVFYSLLVGKAAVSGSVLATGGAIFGVIVGLVVTLTVLTDGEEAPALPVSIFFGMTLHFGILYLLEPLIEFAILT